VMMEDSSELASYPRLKNKVVLITGASSGIGEATAKHFAHCGSNLILGARRLQKLEALKKELEDKHHITVHIGTLDVCSSQSVAEFVKGIPESLASVDVLVNNAGLALGKADTHVTLEADIDRMFDTNVKGLLRMTQAIVPEMIQRNSGHIINIGSVAGLEAYKGGSAYCGSKHAVQAITVAQRKELAHTNLRVSIVSPGMVETEFSVVRFGDKQKADDVYKGIKPLTGADIADNVVYTASRPPHVQVAEMLIFPSAQASAEVIHKNL